jgi:hypothetical protein
MDHMFCSRSTQASWVFLVRAGALCAVVCLSFGSTLAIIVDMPFQHRMQTLLFTGLLPAVAFYAGGRLSFRIAMIGAERGREYLIGALWHGYAYVFRTLEKIPVLAQKTYYAALILYHYLRKSVFELSCLIIRSTARLLLRIQAGFDRYGIGDSWRREQASHHNSCDIGNPEMQKCWS